MRKRSGESVRRRGGKRRSYSSSSGKGHESLQWQALEILELRMLLCGPPVWPGQPAAHEAQRIEGAVEDRAELWPARPVEDQMEVLAESTEDAAARAAAADAAAQQDSNHPPVVYDMSVAVDKGVPYTEAFAAEDFDGDDLTFRVVDGPSHGTLTIDNTAGAFTYTPDGTFLGGADSFHFVANDGQVDSNEGTVTVTVHEYKANAPIGEAKGIHPGRVAWVHDPAATPWDGSTGRWWEDGNTDQEVVDDMLSRSVRWLTGAASEAAAWEMLFTHYNHTHGHGSRGYEPGEKIAVKINLNNTSGSYGDSDNQLDASPQMVLALLRQLVNVAGVAQDMITVFDAVRLLPDRIFDKCNAEFPHVRYEDRAGGGVRVATEWVNNAIDYSVDNGCGESIPRSLDEADYAINMALLKAHGTAGVTLTAKNHYGSINDREHWYINSVNRPMAIYNPLVDLAGHEHIGGKTMLYLIDGLYGTNSHDGTPERFQAAPFSDHWSSSLLASQDPVAIDSVAVDFLVDQFGQAQPFMHRCDNYLHEAALAENPPSGTFYDPEGDGSGLTSLGVHEHWNNSADRQYSRNLGSGDGIALVTSFIPNDETGRRVFYNNSAFDGNDPGANQQDDGAIATDKTALQPGQTATFANYTSYSRGINGVMVDIAWLANPDELDLDNLGHYFEFHVGNHEDPESWPEGPIPTEVAVRESPDNAYAKRVTIAWPDYAIRNQWLQVTVLANAEYTGLTTPDVFYVGNAVGESGNAAADAEVGNADVLLAQDNPYNFFNPATITCPYDYNRDARVNATDMLIARSNPTDEPTALKLIDLRGLGGAAAAAEIEEVSPYDAVLQQAAERGRGTGPICRNGPKGASHKLDLSPSSISAGNWAWLYEFEQPGTRTRPSKKTGSAEAAMDKLLPTFWW